MKEITIDHIIPRSRGGADHLDNYQLAHFPCNQDKDSMLPAEFSKFQERVLSE
jgi:5-methylcytosine-specific restriction endonuclease McrA